MLYFPLMFSHPISLEIRGGALGEAGRREPVPRWWSGRRRGPGPCTRSVGPPTSLGRCRWRQGGEPGLRAQSSCRGGAAREEGGNSGPAVLRPGWAPTFPPSACCRWQLRRRLKPTLQPLGLPLPPPPSPERVAA